MTGETYTQLTVEELNREYNNRLQRPGEEFAAFVKYCRNMSLDARSRLSCALDVQYGAGDEERLDIFTPEGGARAPVNIFFHGGYWRAFTKDEFSYVALGGVPEGIVTVVVNYSLIPNVTMGTLIDQCRKAVAWTWENIEKYSGDPSKIYVSGHSAGAHIVSMLMCSNVDVFRGACAISGVFDLEPVRRTFLNETLTFSNADVARFSSIAITPVVRCPLLCAVGAAESSEFIRQTREFADRWKTHGVDVGLEILAGKDHFSIREDLGNPGAPMTRLLINHLRHAVS